MNLRFIGDALDHWKGSVFEGLRQSNLLRDFRVDAMASDGEAWQQHDYVLFAKLLRIHEEQIVSHKQTLDNNREGYFDEIPADGDLFLDPDTGFQTGHVKNIRQYVKPEEFFSLLSRNNGRVIAVYQHASRKGIRVRAGEVLQELYNKKSKFFCTSYESPTVALLFFSLDLGRIEAIREHFHDLLGAHANKRIGQWYKY
jgi:hypothetical protein